MPIRKATAVWDGTLEEGQGRMRLESGAYDGAFSYASRFEEAEGSNPEELLGAAQAGCFSMFLAGLLADAGHPPKQIRTSAKVHLREGPRIALIELETEAEVADLDEDVFQQYVDEAKKNCPVSKALSGPELRVSAQLVR